VIAIFEDGFVLNSNPPYTDPLTKASNFTANIDWGDGKTGVGQIVADFTKKGLYYIVASHDYAQPLFFPHTFKIAVTVKDKDGAQGSDNSYVTIQPSVPFQPIYPPPAVVKPTFFSTSPLRTQTSLLA
jgi:hypothetical protein